MVILIILFGCLCIQKNIKLELLINFNDKKYMSNSIQFFEFKIFTDPLYNINFKKKLVINTINPHSFCLTKNDKTFKNALLESDILLPDGIGIVYALKFLNNIKVKKIAGFDLFIFLMKKMQDNNGKVFFLGSSIENLTKIKIKLNKEYPNVLYDSFSPPFKSKFTEMDSKIMCSKINKFKPDILFVGMTAPKQEKWVYKNQKEIDSNIICSIGAVFDFYSDNIKRAPKFIITLGLEWLHRSFMSKRLLVRNLISNPKFIFYILKLKLFQLIK